MKNNYLDIRKVRTGKAAVIVLFVVLVFLIILGIIATVNNSAPTIKQQADFELTEDFSSSMKLGHLSAKASGDSEASSVVINAMPDKEYELREKEAKDWASVFYKEDKSKFEKFLTSGYILNRGYAITVPILGGAFDAYLFPSRVLWDQNQGIVNGYSCDSLRANPPAHQAMPIIRFSEFEAGFKKVRRIHQKEAEEFGIPKQEMSEWKIIPITLHLSTPELRKEMLEGLSKRMGCPKPTGQEPVGWEPVLIPLAEAKIMLEAPSFQGPRLVNVPIQHGFQPLYHEIGLPVRTSDISRKTAREFSESIKVALLQSRWGFFAKYDFSSLSMRILGSLSNEEIRSIVSSSAISSINSTNSSINAGITAKVGRVLGSAGGQKGWQNTVAETKPIAVTGDELRTILGVITSMSSAYSSVEISEPKNIESLFSRFKVSENEKFISDPVKLADWLETNSRPDLASILRKPAGPGGSTSSTPSSVEGSTNEKFKGEGESKELGGGSIDVTSEGDQKLTGGESKSEIVSTSPPLSQDLFLLNQSAREELLNRSVTSVALSKIRVPSSEMTALVIEELKPQVNEVRSANSFSLRSFGSETNKDDEFVKSGEKFLHRANGRPRGEGDIIGSIRVRVTANFIQKESPLLQVSTKVTVEGNHIYESNIRREFTLPKNSIGLGNDNSNPKNEMILEFIKAYSADKVGQNMGDNPWRENIDKEESGFRIFNSFVSPYVSHKHNYRAKTGGSIKPRWETRCCHDYDNTANSIEARLNIEVPYIIQVSPETTVFTNFQLPTPQKITE